MKTYNINNMHKVAILCADSPRERIPHKLHEIYMDIIFNVLNQDAHPKPLFVNSVFQAALDLVDELNE